MTEQDIFVDAVQIADPADRDAFLDRACAGDPALRARVAGLMAALDRAGSFLGGPAAVTVDPDATRGYEAAGPAEKIGSVVGPYALLEAIGEGGMGVVYAAEQKHPVRRKVALKVVKPGMDSKQMLARFEAERQALALMDHPNIARVLDAGATEQGRPYFVMELVRGLPVTDYCDQARLTVRERLRLFADVCRAVQHAHQKGVIHRDLKPSNILVTVVDGRPVPKVIDFGIAKAAGAALTDRTLHTGHFQLVGTPLYMSPEQAELSGVDVDTRADVYSLGVVLYELLTGTTPFDPAALRDAGLDEFRRIIREDEPARPSRRVSTLDARQSSTVAGRRGVDARRLGRLVRGELDWVVMRALEKDRGRRYQSPAELAADVDRFLSGAAVTAAPPSALYRARKFVRRHRTELTLAAVVVGAAFTVLGVLGWSAWDRATRRTIAEAAATAALDESAEHYRADRPDAAMAAAKRAVDTLIGVPGAEHALAGARLRVADLAMADRLEDLVLIGVEAGKGPTDNEVADAVRLAFQDYGIDPVELTEAEAAERIRGRAITRELADGLDVWAAARRAGHDQTDSLATKLRAVAAAADPDPWSCRVRDAWQDGTPGVRAALAAEIPPASAPPFAVSRLAKALERDGRRAEAEALLRRAGRLRPNDLRTHFALADLLRQSRTEATTLEALGCYRACLAVRPRSAAIRDRIGILMTDNLNRPSEGAEWFRDALSLNPHYHMARVNLSVALNKQGKFPEALDAARAAVAVLPRAETYYQLGLTLVRLRRADEAAAAFRAAVGTEPRVSHDHYWRGMALEQLGRRDEAIAAYREMIGLRPGDPRGYEKVGFLLSERGEDDEAMNVYRDALKVNPDNALVHSRVGILLRRRGRPDEAVKEYQDAVRLEPKNRAYHFNLGNALSDLKRFEEATAAYRKAIEIDPNYPEAHVNLGDHLLRRGNYAEALAAYRRGHELGSKTPGWRYPSAELVETARRVAALEPRLPAILAGTDTPTDPADTAAAARVAHDRGRYARAAELYRVAIAAGPKTDLRFSGACSAARAGCGQDGDGGKLDDATRAAWRQRALEWLRAELAAREKLLAGGTTAPRRAELYRLRNWNTDADLAGVRDAAALAKLPDAERAEWERLWADVRAALSQAPAPAPGKP